MVRQHALGELRVETAQRREDVRAAPGVGRDRTTLVGSEPPLLVNDVEERFVDLPNVVKEGNALNHAAFAVAESRGVGDDERVGRDAPDVSAGLRVIGVDGV